MTSHLPVDQFDTISCPTSIKCHIEVITKKVQLSLQQTLIWIILLLFCHFYLCWVQKLVRSLIPFHYFISCKFCLFSKASQTANSLLTCSDILRQPTDRRSQNGPPPALLTPGWDVEPEGLGVTFREGKHHTHK